MTFSEEGCESEAVPAELTKAHALVLTRKKPRKLMTVSRSWKSMDTPITDKTPSEQKAVSVLARLSLCLGSLASCRGSGALGPSVGGTAGALRSPLVSQLISVDGQSA